MSESFLSVSASTALAKTIAETNGIRIEQTDNVAMPKGSKGQITMGTPSLYDHEEYLEQLHSVIGQVAPQNEFFDNVESADERQEAHKQILRHHTCDKFMNGIYQGRDRLIASGYSKQAKRINDKLEEIASVDSTSAALLYLANECRNDWQNYNHMDVPDGLQPHIDKLRPVQDKIMSLETEDDLREVLKFIQEEEYDESSGEGSSGEGGDSDDSEGRDPDGSSEEYGGSDGGESDSEGGDEGTSDSGEGSGSDGEGSDGEGDREGDRGAEGGGEGEGDGGDREGDEGSEGGASDSEGSSGSDSEGGVGGDEGSEGGGDASGEDSGDASGEGESGGEGGDSSGDSGEQESDNSEAGGEGEGTGDDASDGGGSSSSGRGESDAGEQDAEGVPSQSAKGDSGSLLRDLGITQDATEDQKATPNVGPYTPTYMYSNEYITDKHTHDASMKERILKEAEDLRLSTKVAKYLKAMSQKRMQMGQRSGHLCNSKVYRATMYNGMGGQPRMFKRQQASKITQDVAITLLIDASGSMGKGKYSKACACGIAMSRVLQKLKVPHEIISFNTGWGEIDDGRPRVEHSWLEDYDERVITNNVIKPFEELRVSRDSLAQRFSHRERTHGANADGESLFWATGRLAKRDETKKMIIVMSDGSPAYDGGKGDDGQYLKDIVEKIEEAPNWDIYGIGIQDHSVQHYYARNRVLGDLKDLEPLVIDLVKEKIVN